MLRTEGRKILNDKGEEIRLRGINLGNWMLIEPNMMGSVGTEIRLRRAMENYAGKEKTECFFRGLLDKWVTEADIFYLKSLGFNSVRIPLNYRYFEDDMAPFEYKTEGFDYLDRVFTFCTKADIYVILDLHAVQGYQNGDWHCNNIFQERTDIYYDKNARERYYALWRKLAERYKDQRMLAGYDLMNEPLAESKEEINALNEIYSEVIQTIRKEDPNHILFIEGNQWAQRFEEIKDFSAYGNIVYSPHYYCEAAVQDADYPGIYRDAVYNIEGMCREMDSRDQWIIEHNAPCWVGEFGVRRLGDLKGKDRALRDYIQTFEKRGHSWCYWNFKDLRVRGPLKLDKNSRWAAFVDEFADLKKKYCTDRSLPEDRSWTLDFIFKDCKENDFVCPKEVVRERVMRNIRETLADQLTQTFAKRFAELSMKEIDELTDSFLLKNCVRYSPWEKIFRGVTGKDEGEL